MFEQRVKLVVLFCLSLLFVLFIASGQVPTSRVVDLDKGEENIRILGDDPGDILGNAVAVGDINGDDYQDLFISASGANSGIGEVYVILGSSKLPLSIDLSSESADMTIYGVNNLDYFGSGISSGDINGDGFDDLIIGAWGVDTAGGIDSGATYIFFGKSLLPITVDLKSESADMTIYGDGGGNSGLEVSSNDINADGYDDVIIGANRADPEGRSDAGKTYVIFGSSSTQNSIDLHSESADITIYGAKNGDQSGIAVSSGDINGDEYDDVIIGAYCADPFGRAQAGESYVIFGGNHTSGKIINLNTDSADITIYGADADDFSGNAVGSGDINDDGYDDLIIGAWDASPTGGYRAGESYVIFGKTSPPATIDLNILSMDMIIYGDNSGDELGRRVASNDINNDGFDDLIIGAYGGDKVYIVLGGNPPPRKIIDLDSETADVNIYSEDENNWCGWSVDCGDINQDNYDDVLIGALKADPGGRSNAGKAYVIFGNGLPIECDFSDADISDWEKVGYGKARIRKGKLVLYRAHKYLRLFPPGAVSQKCDIEVKVQHMGGFFSRGSSSIFFGYEDKLNYWELKMKLSKHGRIPGEWILQHIKDGSIVQKEVVEDNIYRKHTYLIKIEVRGDQIRVIVDSVEKINLTPDEKPAWGKIGLGISRRGVTYFDDLLIY